MKTKLLIPLIAGLGLLCACKGKGPSESADTTYVVANNAKSVNRTDTIQSHPKVVKTADMRFQVKDVQQTTEKITALTTSFNGTVVHHWMKSIAGDSVDIRKSNDSIMRVTVINSTAEMTVKIPPANVENFMNEVAHLGIYIKNRKMDVSDKTLDYLSTRLKLKNQNELVNQQKKETPNKKTPDDLLAFKNNMVDQQINNRKIDDSVKNSVITLSFYEDNTISKKIIANNDLSAYNLPFSKRMAMSFENGWNIFVDILAGVANFWVLMPVGLGVWMVVRYYKSKALVKS
jgi:Domain of unknown function (DUF4349)